MPFGLGLTEIVIILVVILVVFGIGNLPRIGSALGKTMKSFRTGQVENKQEIVNDDDEKIVKPRRKTKGKVS